MKGLLTTDWHSTDSVPENRMDDYTTALINKINFIYNLSIEKKVDDILHAGDLCDNALLGYGFYSILFNLIRIKTATIYGQHDLKYRNKGNTPLDALNQTHPLIHILTKEPLLVDNCHIYGASYGEKVPEIINKNMFNILVIHKMLLHTQEQSWQEGYDLGQMFLRNHNFDLIVSGDNHQSFYCKEKNRYLFNCGSLMRSRIDQIEHKPRVYIFDTKKRTFEEIFIPITPWKKVFDLEKKKKKEEMDEQIKTFVSNLAKHKDVGLSFVDNLHGYLKRNKVDSAIQNIIERNMIKNG